MAAVVTAGFGAMWRSGLSPAGYGRGGWKCDRANLLAADGRGKSPAAGAGHHRLAGILAVADPQPNPLRERPARAGFAAVDDERPSALVGHPPQDFRDVAVRHPAPDIDFRAALELCRVDERFMGLPVAGFAPFLVCRPSGVGCGDGGVAGVGQCLGELRAGADLQLAVDAAEVDLDSLDG